MAEPAAPGTARAAATEPDPDAGRQPWLHALEIAVHGNLTCLSEPSGDFSSLASGLYVDDRRVLSALTLRCDGLLPTAIAAQSAGGRTAVMAVARHLGAEGPDPTVEVERVRVLHHNGMREKIVVRSRADAVVRSSLTLQVGGDGADLADVKGGGAPGPGLAAEVAGRSTVGWSDQRHRTRVHLPGATARLTPDGAVLEWQVALDPGTEAAVELAVEVTRTSSSQFDAEPGGDRLNWSDVRVQAQDRRLDATVHQSLVDLTGLLLSDPDGASDVFAAAGSPWYLTLFGRDALWTARMTLPFGTDLAAGTLRTLARRQGRVDDVAAAEEPGKILHEVRRSGFADPSSHLHLPPVYFGTVDATPLWVCLLHEAWRWGLPVSAVLPLRGALEGALGWMRRAVRDSADGFIRYVDTTGTGLSNQGWKDSGDAMRHRNGSIAKAPIALVETQAYAVAAAYGAAEVTEQVFGESGAELRTWAEELSERVRGSFWVRDAAGPYLAMALDADGAPVDGVGSNMGHTLGTGMLTEAESDLVAARVGDPDLLGGFGLRTLSRSNPAFNPIGYHTGSVWTHDSAITAAGLAQTGHQEPAARILRGLVDAGTFFSFRLPELYGGDSALSRPVPYPAACRPQAWSAASAAVLVSASLGAQADVPQRRLLLNPLRPSPFGALQVTGLRVAGEPVSVSVDAAGAVTEVSAPSWLEVEVAG